MITLQEKREMATAWINAAPEAEIDALLETIYWETAKGYPPAIIELLDTRWEHYKSGKSPHITLDELKHKLGITSS